jgi:uncharacterized protein
MIPLAISDWPLTRELLARRELDVDYFETTSRWADTAVPLFPGQPMLLHNALNNVSLGKPGVHTGLEALELTRRRLAATRAPWLSVHLGFSAAEVAFTGYNEARSPALGRDELFASVCANLGGLRDALDLPLIVENLDYNPGGAYEHICEPAFIAAVLERTGVGLLLDLAHAQVSATHLGMSIDAYLAALPLDRVAQLHLSSPRWKDGVLRDAHEPLLEQDYALLRAVLGAARPRAVTLEYHRDEAALKEQITRLRGILTAYQG